MPKVSKQHQALANTERRHTPISDDEATTLLAALALGSKPDHAPFRQHHHDAEYAVKRRGLIHSDHIPNHAEVNPDVLYSLRYNGH